VIPLFRGQRADAQGALVTYDASALPITTPEPFMAHRLRKLAFATCVGVASLLRDLIIKDHGAALIEGVVHGADARKGSLLVNRSGALGGDIYASNVIVLGRLGGPSIETRMVCDRLIVSSTAVLHNAQIQYRSLHLHEDAQLQDVTLTRIAA
jgi:hypothetical protein